MNRKGLNLLHWAALNKRNNKISFLIDCAKNEYTDKEFCLKISQEDFAKWINAKTNDDGWAPLHLATYSENMEAIKTLIAN